MNRLKHHSDQGPEMIELPQMPEKPGYIFHKGVNSVSYRATQGDDKIIYELRTQELNFLHKHLQDKRIIILKQMHSDKYSFVSHKEYERRRNTEGEPFIWAEADALITQETGFALTIITADCLPIFLYAPSAPVFAAVHAGWQGTYKRITQKVGQAILETGILPQHLYAAIFPGIAGMDYEIREDVAQYFPDYITYQQDKFKKNKIYLDLISANCDQLSRLGIAQENIGYVPMSTATNNDKLFSHRKGDVGRNINVLLT